MKEYLNSLIDVVMIVGASFIFIIQGVFMIKYGESLTNFHLRIYERYGLKLKGKWRKYYKDFDVRFSPYILFFLGAFLIYYFLFNDNGKTTNYFTDMGLLDVISAVVLFVVIILNGICSIFFYDQFLNKFREVLSKTFDSKESIQVSESYAFLYRYASILALIFVFLFLFGVFLI